MINLAICSESWFKYPDCPSIEGSRGMVCKLEV